MGSIARFNEQNEIQRSICYRNTEKRHGQVARRKASKNHGSMLASADRELVSSERANGQASSQTSTADNMAPRASSRWRDVSRARH